MPSTVCSTVLAPKLAAGGSCTSHMGAMQDTGFMRLDAVDGVATGAIEMQLLTPAFVTLLLEQEKRAELAMEMESIENQLKAVVAAITHDELAQKPSFAVQQLTSTAAAALSAHDDEDEDDDVSDSSSDAASLDDVLSDDDEDDDDEAEEQLAGGGSLASATAMFAKDNTSSPAAKETTNDIETRAANVMDALLRLSSRYEVLGGLLQTLQALQSSCDVFTSPSSTTRTDCNTVLPLSSSITNFMHGRDSPVAEAQLKLAALSIDIWNLLNNALNDSFVESKDASSTAAAACGALWQEVSSAVGTAIACLLKQGMLGALIDRLEWTASAMQEHAASLACIFVQRPLAAAHESTESTQLPVNSQQFEGGVVVEPELVPFTDFEPIAAAQGGVDSSVLEGCLEDDDNDFGNAELETDGGIREEGEEGEDALMLRVNDEEEIEEVDIQELMQEDSDDDHHQPQEELSLLTALSATADATGALATLEAVQYLTSLAIQQYQPQHAQHELQFASFTWLHEPELLTKYPGLDLGSFPLLTTTLHLSPSSSSNSGDGGASGIVDDTTISLFGARAISDVLNSEPSQQQQPQLDVTLSCHRYQILHTLKENIATLANTAATLQEWQARKVGVERELVYEITTAMQQSMSTTEVDVHHALHAVLNEREQWLAQHDAVVGLAQSVVEFEDSRTPLLSSFNASSLVDGGENISPPAANGIEKYAWIANRMHQVASSLSQSQAKLQFVGKELELLLNNTSNAATLLKDAEEEAIKAEKELNNQSLALVRSTQAFGPTVESLHSLVSSTRPHLTAFQNIVSYTRNVVAAAKKCDAISHLSKLAVETHSSFEIIQTMLSSVPRVVNSLYHAVHAVKMELSQGGRGQAAAQKQVVLVVEGLREAMTALHEFIVVLSPPSSQEKHQNANAILKHVPAMVGRLQTEMNVAVSQLSASYGIDLSSLATLMQLGSSSSGGGDDNIPSTSNSTIAASSIRQLEQQQLSARLYGIGSRPTAEQRALFAAKVMQVFEKKLLGALPCSSGGGDKNNASSNADVAEQVQRLIKLATSVDNLSRMFEGWTAWI